MNFEPFYAQNKNVKSLLFHEEFSHDVFENDLQIYC